MPRLAYALVVSSLFGCDPSMMPPLPGPGPGPGPVADSGEVPDPMADAGPLPAPDAGGTVTVRKSLQNGTRLQVRVRRGSDGSVMPRGEGLFYDNDLDTNCAVRPASDDQLRCLPDVVHGD